MLKAILVNSEQLVLNELENNILKVYSDQLLIVDKCRSLSAAFQSIQQMKPDLVFVDVGRSTNKLDDGEIIEVFQQEDFGLVFISDSEEDNMRVYELSAVPYIKRPLTKQRMQKVIEKALIKQNRSISIKQLKLLVHNINATDVGGLKIMLPTFRGIFSHFLKEIKYCEAYGKHTKIYIQAKFKPIYCMHSIERLSTLLPTRFFFRIQQSCYINGHCISEYRKTNGRFVIMDDKSTFSIAESNKMAFDQWFESLI